MSEINKEKISSVATYLRLLKALKKYLLTFIIGAFATISASGLTAAVAWAIKPIINKGLVDRNPLFIKWLPLMLITLFLSRAIVTFLSKYCINRVGRTIVMDARQQIFEHLLHLPASFYDRQSSGKLLSLVIYNANQLASATTDTLLTLIREGSMVVCMVVVMVVVSWRLTLAFLLVAPVVTLIIKIMTKRLHKLSLYVQESVGSITHISRESIDGYKVIRTFGGEKYEWEKFDKANRLNRHRELKVVVTEAIGTSAVQVLVALPMIGIIYVVASSQLNISVGGFGAMIVAVLQLLTPLRRLTKINTNLQKGIAGAQSIFDLLDTEAEKDFGTTPLLRSKGKINYSKVCFTYPNTQKTVLHDVNLEIQPGQRVAFVGHSGSGKSTLISLLARFYDVCCGSILIDGVDVKNYKLADLRKQFAFVSQHITLFHDTIAHNIAYGRLAEVKREDIIKAAETAHIMEFVGNFADGLDTIIGEQGLMLSGGQRQRLAIARAILKDAPILVLDEATSALDAESEQLIQNTLENLMHKRTTLIIAHRLSTIEKADRIVVLNQGKIVETGTHDELLKLSGYYSKLYKMQFRE